MIRFIPIDIAGTHFWHSYSVPIVGLLHRFLYTGGSFEPCLLYVYRDESSPLITDTPKNITGRPVAMSIPTIERIRRMVHHGPHDDLWTAVFMASAFTRQPLQHIGPREFSLAGDFFTCVARYIDKHRGLNWLKICNACTTLTRLELGLNDYPPTFEAQNASS
jgi:hypothetical protein